MSGKETKVRGSEKPPRVMDVRGALGRPKGLNAIADTGIYAHHEGLNCLRFGHRGFDKLTTSGC